MAAFRGGLSKSGSRRETFVAVRRIAPMSPCATHFVNTLRAEMESDGKARPARGAGR
jgi:hypothetical protein